MSKKNRTLGHYQFLELSEWVKERKEEFQRDKTITYVRIQERAQKELGFPISPRTVSDLCDHHGIETSKPLKTPRASAKKIEQLEDRISEMEKYIKISAQEHGAVMERLQELEEWRKEWED